MIVLRLDFGVIKWVYGLVCGINFEREIGWRRKVVRLEGGDFEDSWLLIKLIQRSNTSYLNFKYKNKPTQLYIYLMKLFLLLLITLLSLISCKRFEHDCGSYGTSRRYQRRFSHQGRGQLYPRGLDSRRYGRQFGHDSVEEESSQWEKQMILL